MKNKKDLAIALDTDFELLKKMPDQIDYLYYKLFDERTLVINNDVDDCIIDNFLLPIYKFNQDDKDIPVEERKPIQIFINTNGGDLIPALGLISAIITSKTPVYTVNIGRAYSAGALILLSGHRRFSYKYASTLIHEGSMFAYNSTSKAQEQFEFMKKQENQIKEFITSRTKISPELYDKNYKVEWYFTAEEALEYGVIDEII